jgi:hypothetical protein
MPRWHPLPLARGCPEGVQVGSGVSEVQAAFVTGLATPVLTTVSLRSPPTTKAAMTCVTFDTATAFSIRAYYYIYI